MAGPSAERSEQDGLPSTASSPSPQQHTAVSCDAFHDPPPPADPFPLPLGLAIEPDLRLLKGLITVLRYLGERSASDPIHPGAIAAVSAPAEEAIDRLLALRGQDHLRG